MREVPNRFLIQSEFRQLCVHKILLIVTQLHQNAEPLYTSFISESGYLRGLFGTAESLRKNGLSELICVRGTSLLVPLFVSSGEHKSGQSGTTFVPL
jgi:hypothetical protein